ncbi:hypothetical protein ACPXCP_34725 [Streptomyces sp. DT20]|uniref:hypothetical protein n=1 Tax=unclassified Streptomyces TaxID=2593676 RepID=UPI00093D69D8|nr:MULTISPECIES: hypothetical protein [unclassified Streptomyces]OKK13218.1 hypothetical protein AMK09_28655 [Streptomyces sp. CB02488]WNI34561.1 hypothetical protein RLT59_38825 [Streptomyces sp. ITFR-6]WRZ16880.1 hypothetical protein OG892_39200 [Streptomyces sp. NBC_00341]
MKKTSLSLHKQGGTFVIDGLGSPTAALEFDRGMRTGTVTSGGRALPIAATGRLRTRVTAGEPAILCLDGPEAFVPGGGAPVEWRTSKPHRGRYHATLVRGSDLIDFSLAKSDGKSVRIEVSGSWDQLELIALAGSFALLSRRRGDTYLKVAFVSVISGGQHTH